MRDAVHEGRGHEERAVRARLLWLPFVAFAAVLTVVVAALSHPADPIVRSAMIGRPLPAVTLPALVPPHPGIDPARFRAGRPRLLNVFASWCIPCAAEAPQLDRLRARGVPIDAVAVHDTAPAVAAFLRRYGDPYQRIGDDKAGALQIALGSSGVPETFLIAGDGTVVSQHIGDIRADQVDAIARAVEASR